MIKRITSLFLAFTILTTCLIGATNMYASDNKYYNEKSETVIYDGIEYKYIDEFVNGKEITHILNLTNNTEDILYFDEVNGIIYLNNEPIAFVEDVILSENISSETGISPLAGDSYWGYNGTTTKRITWAQGVAAAVLAGIIAAVIPNVGKVAVILKIGLSALGVVAAACGGAYVDCASYSHVLMDGKIEFRLNWTFRPSTGDVYGPYSKYIL